MKNMKTKTEVNMKNMKTKTEVNIKYLYWAVTILVILTSSVAANARELIQGEEDKINVIYSVEIGEDGNPKAIATKTTIPPENIKIKKVTGKSKPDKIPEKKLEKIHPKLKEMVKESPPSEMISVIINLVDTDTKPLPGANVKDDLTKKRNKAQAPLIKKYESKYNAKIKEQFWLINAIVADIPVGSIEKLSKESKVIYIQPQEGGEPLPDNNIYNDADDGRWRINSDPYFSYNLNLGYIGLLDSGVKASHTLFRDPLDDNLDFLRDCVNGGADCNTPGPGFYTGDTCNHGTSAAAILVGNANLGNAYRGVTNVILDSWRVYPTCTLDSVAAVRGFQNAVWVGDTVIVAEMQAAEDIHGAIATAADNAFDLGAVVIAPNGNCAIDNDCRILTGTPRSVTVQSPALAHKVIGVGAFDVETLATMNYQGRGPTSDYRIKPDIQAPTNTETASTRGGESGLRLFGGTSGAAPYGAGGATLLNNWLRSNGATEPGYTYARIILSGKAVYPFDDTEGGGDMVLPTDGWGWWGKVDVYQGSFIEIPIDVELGKTKLEAALWWPERVTEAHDDVDLVIIDPYGTPRARSVSSPSVFEHTEVTEHLVVGTWKILISGDSILSGPQLTYFAINLKN